MRGSFFNPFREIIETQKFPYARPLRTSFTQKWDDAFYVIAGHPFSPESPEREHSAHLGLIDYITLFIPALLLRCLEWCQEGLKDEDSNARMFYMPVLIINAPLLLGRILLSFLIAVIASPIIAFVHVCTTLLAQKDKKIALSIPVSPKQTLQEYLSEHQNVDLDALSITVSPVSSVENSSSIDSQNEKPTTSYQLIFWQRNNPATTLPSEIGRTIVDVNRQEQITKLCTLNIGHLAEVLEERGQLESFIKMR